MMHRLRRLLSFDLDGDNLESRTAYWIYPLLYFMLIILLLLIVLTAFSSMTPQDKAGFTTFNLIGLAFCACLYVLARRGHLRLAALGMVTCVYLGAALPSAFLFGTIRAPNISGFFVLVPMTALLLGKIGRASCRERV